MADGLATRTPDAGNVRVIRELVGDVCLVSEAQLLDAIRHLLFEEHVVAEPAGAAATAALLSANIKNQGNVVLLVTGANIARDVLRTAVCG
jgi:threonine dehydratase